MKFAYPWVLLAVLPLAAAVWWVLTGGERRRRRLPYPAASALGQAALPPAWPLARWAPTALRALALLLVVIALARPQRLGKAAQGSGRGIDIMLAVDTSPSMAALDIAPSRLEAAKTTAHRFIEGRVQDRIGLIVIGGVSQLACPLTTDYDALIEQLNSLSPGMTLVNGTALGDGVISGLNHLRDSDAKSKVIILLTDGRSNTGLIDAATAAKAAASLGVKVYTIGTAGHGPARLSYVDPRSGPVQGVVEDDLDEELLSQISAITDGRYFRATSLKQLNEIYAMIDKLEKSKIELPPIVSRDDLYQPFVLAAALLLAAEAGLANTLWLRWP